MSLTKKQSELLTFIDGYIKESHGVAPSFDEMAAAVQQASKSGVHRLIEALEDKGYIRRLPHRARAIDVIRRAGDPPAPSTNDTAAERYRAALMKIAAGEGAYGAQAHEYKQIARTALGWAT